MSHERALEILKTWAEKGQHTLPSPDAVRTICDCSWEEWIEAHALNTEHGLTQNEHKE